VRNRIRRLAPWVVSLTAALAFVEFVRALLDAGQPRAMAVVLPTGVVIALVSLSWFTVCGPGGRLTA